MRYISKKDIAPSANKFISPIYDTLKVIELLILYIEGQYEFCINITYSWQFYDII